MEGLGQTKNNTKSTDASIIIGFLVIRKRVYLDSDYDVLATSDLIRRIGNRMKTALIAYRQIQEYVYLKTFYYCLITLKLIKELRVCQRSIALCQLNTIFTFHFLKIRIFCKKTRFHLACTRLFIVKKR